VGAAISTAPQARGKGSKAPRHLGGHTGGWSLLRWDISKELEPTRVSRYNPLLQCIFVLSQFGERRKSY